MSSNYKIIDNALNISDFMSLKELLMQSNFNWYYQQNVAYGKIDKGEDYEEETFYFTHTFYEKDEPKSSHFYLLKPVLEKLNVSSLYRAKANLYPNQNKIIRHPFHTDTNFECKGAILYINTNNGKTILKDNTEIDSVSNRLLLFNSFEEHCSTNCTDEKTRVNINFNYF
jgi:hypothetical protein